MKNGKMNLNNPEVIDPFYMTDKQIKDFKKKAKKNDFGKNIKRFLICCASMIVYGSIPAIFEIPRNDIFAEIALDGPLLALGVVGFASFFKAVKPDIFHKKENKDYDDYDDDYEVGGKKK